MRRVLAVVLAASLGLAGCGVMPGAAPDLEGTSWRAISVAGQPPVPGREPTASFSGAKITGTTGCNGYGGLFAIEGTRLQVTEIGSTAMGCDDPIGTIEKLFMEVLSSARSVRVEGQNLVIGGVSGEIVLVAAPLVGP